MSIKKSLLHSLFWITLALIFNAGIYLFYSPKAGLDFLAGYLIEKSLSVDNLFVFFVLFSFFKVPKEYQDKVLNYGIIGALILRLAMIIGGVLLIKKLHAITYFMGIILLISGYRFLFQKEKVLSPERSFVVRLFRRYIPFSNDYNRGNFFIREKTKVKATPLLLCLVMIEITDLIFAIDSIPAIFAITTDPFIVYSSNVFAILGLRSLYFLVAQAMETFHYLKFGLGAILIFIGLKFILNDYVEIGTPFALGVIALCLLVPMGFVLLKKKNSPRQ